MVSRASGQQSGMGIFGEAAVESIPGPSAWEEIVFVSPWTPAVVIAALGIVAAVVMLKFGQSQRRAILMGGAGLALGFACVLTASLVTITREKLADQTRRLIDAAASGDAEAAGAMLSSDAKLSGLWRSGTVDRTRVLRMVGEELKGRFALRDWSVGTLRSVMDSETVARTQVHVTATAKDYAVPTGSWWILSWRRERDGAWRVYSIQCQHVDGIGKGGL